MYKDLKFDVGYLAVNPSYLIGRKFTSKHNAGKAQVTQPAHFLRSTVIGLRRSMELERIGRSLTILRFHFTQQRHILHEDSIDTSLCQLLYELSGGFKFIVIEDSVYSNIYLHTKRTGIVTKTTDVVDTVPNSRTGSKTRGTDINGICTMVYGRHATLQILGGRKKF